MWTNVARYLLQVSKPYNEGDGRCVDNVIEIILHKSSFPQEAFFETESTVFC